MIIIVRIFSSARCLRQLRPSLLLTLLLALPCTARAQAADVTAAGPVSVTNLEVNGAPQPLGIDDPRPRLSWRLASRQRGVLQRAYRVRVASAPDLLLERATDVWDSGRVSTPEPYAIYGGPDLRSSQRLYWSVRVWTEDGDASAWSEPSSFEMALLEPEAWQARWIAGPERNTEPLSPEDGEADDAEVRRAGDFCRPVGWPAEGFFPDQVPNPEGECREVRPAPMLRTSFAISKDVTRARLYTVGLAYNDLRLNGDAVSSAVLDPGFTDYSESVYYTTHDVAALLRPGENVLSTTLGSGQFDSSTRTWDWGWDRAEWRATPRLRAQLHIWFADGSEEVVVSDDSWTVSTDGPTRYDSYYLGETYDARRAVSGWDRPGFDDAAWAAARVVEAPAGTLRAQAHEPIAVVDVRSPGRRIEPAPGIFVYDVGQNLTGWARIRVDAPAGTPIEVFYSEKRDEDGLLSDDVAYALVGGQLQTDYYIAEGSGDEVWTPRFSYKGFQYVQISSPGRTPLPEGVNVRVDAVEQVRSALEDVGSFSASDKLLERIHRNTHWALQSNLHGIVTDTPIYEKNPWTGDAQLSAGTAALLFDVERLFGKLYQDMIDAQTDQGEVPLLAPSNENYGYVGKPAFKPEDCCGATPAWDAFWFVVPWEAYERFGNVRVLEQTYPAMRAYLDDWVPQWTHKDGDGFAHTLTAGLGDWDAPEGTPTNIALASTAYYAHFAQIASETAHVLGRPDEARHYEDLFERIRSDFNKRFLTAEGLYRDAEDDAFSQTAQILPLAMDLAPDTLRTSLAARLVEDIVESGDNAYVGILGARYVLPVLTEAGHDDVAYAVATQRDYPSWGYWVDELGWTGLGEYWEASSRSRNHHFFGTIVQWMYEHLAGIRPLEPGYGVIAFRPSIPAGLQNVAAEYVSVRGVIRSAWRRSDEGLTMDITVPANAQGLVYVPASRPTDVAESNAARAVPAGEADAVEFVRVDGEHVIYRVGSGTFRFSVAK